MKKTLLELLKAELIGEPPPEGWYTVAELSERLGVKRPVVCRLVERKGWETREYRTVTKDGKLLNAKHYHTGKL
jgi:hypothetical protein